MVSMSESNSLVVIVRNVNICSLGSIAQISDNFLFKPNIQFITRLDVNWIDHILILCAMGRILRGFFPCLARSGGLSIIVSDK